MHCVRSCRPYFSATATQEILDEFRPCLCPFDTVCGDVMCYWDIFLPVHLPPELHHQGFKYDVINEISFIFVYILDYGYRNFWVFGKQFVIILNGNKV